MKYNPRVNETVARLAGLLHIHPMQDPSTVQGALRLLWELQEDLAHIAGMAACSVQPAAGAQGELTGVLMIRAYHTQRGQVARDTILVPDSAHGTNPATAGMVGYQVVAVPSDERGNVDLEHLSRAMNERVAGLMITNPNTLGLFEEHIHEVARIVHEGGGLVYADGANMNALLGIAKPGEFGMDILHYNLHKTFSTPHGGGGPGAGATAVTAPLAPFLPSPLVFDWDDDRPLSIGRLHSFHGNFGNSLRGYAYIRAHGREGLRDVSETAVLNANYVRVRLKDDFHAPFDRFSMHEATLTGKRQAALGVRTLDIAKRLQDYGFHPPTIYFPLTVAEAMLIEPTETESRASLDGFVAAMKAIARETETEPETVVGAPHTTPVRRLDEATAARKPHLTWNSA
jgi:glycine dehydrogenase subunit 2